MHEWLEALRKSARASQPGVPVDEVRRAETECGVPFPADLAALYQSLNGGEFLGDVRLYPLHGAEGQPSVMEKTRLMLVGLPAAGLWRFGLKGQHRHLFTARKSAMVEQGDGGGPLPGWVEPLDDEDWLYGTWDFEERQMRLYRSLGDMLAVLVPPAEEEREGFGERTYARALSAVQGALDELGMEALLGGEALEEEETDEAEEGEAEQSEPEREPTVREVIDALAASLPKRKAAARKAVTKAAAKKPAAKKAAGAGKATKKAPAKKAPMKKASAKKAPAKKVAAKKGARKAPAKKAVRAPARKAAAKKTPAKKGGAARRGKR